MFRDGFEILGWKVLSKAKCYYDYFNSYDYWDIKCVIFYHPANSSLGGHCGLHIKWFKINNFHDCLNLTYNKMRVGRTGVFFFLFFDINLAFVFKF